MSSNLTNGYILPFMALRLTNVFLRRTFKMNELENPPGFIVRTAIQKAASNNGFRLDQGIEDGWIRYGSTTAQGDIWLASASAHGPWYLSLNHPGVSAELKNYLVAV